MCRNVMCECMYACSKYISGCAIQEKEINSKLQPEKDYTWTATYILQYFFLTYWVVVS